VTRRGGRRLDVAELVERARQGQPRAVARLISLVEDGALRGTGSGSDARGQLREVAAALTAHAGRAQVIGLTGAPGVGKSTSAAVLVGALRKAAKRLGVLAVDPSSPFSGGALLGDRIRMQDHALDGGVFIRSMATRGHLGGIAGATPQALRVLDAAGCDVILVETVGVGQSEVEVISLADTTLVLLAPGTGDGVQVAKAGILEVADVFVVNKADRDGADQTVRDLEHMISLGRHEQLGRREPLGRSGQQGASWCPPIVRTVASMGEGADDVLDAIEQHRSWMASCGELDARRARRAEAEIEAIALGQLRVRFGAVRCGNALPSLAKRVVAGELDPYRAADYLVAELGA
jgi:LAO/AO transport system kinase